ncbi:MAG: hypothetical protein GPOALKHO_000990 [Sodalis sp.]|nr:MAG: hypothetical protein GPOALKHO_000990 [Sodalis sp.]
MQRARLRADQSPIARSSNSASTYRQRGPLCLCLLTTCLSVTWPTHFVGESRASWQGYVVCPSVYIQTIRYMAGSPIENCLFGRQGTVRGTIFCRPVRNVLEMIHHPVAVNE